MYEGREEGKMKIRRRREEIGRMEGREEVLRRVREGYVEAGRRVKGGYVGGREEGRE